MPYCACGAELPVTHRQVLRCPTCKAAHIKARDRAGKGIVLADDAVDCPVCHERMNRITAGHYRAHGYASAESFKAAFGLMRMTAPSLLARHAAYSAEHSPTKGKKRTEAEKQLMSERRTGGGIGVCGKYARTAAIRENTSASVTKFYQQDVGRTRGWRVPSKKAGKEVWVRSTWEERVVRVLDACPAVARIRMEPLMIKYPFEGRTKHYLPDVLVTFYNGVQELWEIKPKEFVLWPINVAKFAALNAHAHEHGFNARIVQLHDIEELEAWARDGWKTCPSVSGCRPNTRRARKELLWNLCLQP